MLWVADREVFWLKFRTRRKLQPEAVIFIFYFLGLDIVRGEEQNWGCSTPGGSKERRKKPTSWLPSTGHQDCNSPDPLQVVPTYRLPCAVTVRCYSSGKKNTLCNQSSYLWLLWHSAVTWSWFAHLTNILWQTELMEKAEIKSQASITQSFCLAIIPLCLKSDEEGRL